MVVTVPINQFDLTFSPEFLFFSMFNFFFFSSPESPD